MIVMKRRPAERRQLIGTGEDIYPLSFFKCVIRPDALGHDDTVGNLRNNLRVQ